MSGYIDIVCNPYTPWVLERKLMLLAKQQQERKGGLGCQEKKRLETIIQEKDNQIKEFQKQFSEFMTQIQKY